MKPCPLISILTLLNYVEWKCKARHVDAKCLFINSIKPDFDGWFVCLIVCFFVHFHHVDVCLVWMYRPTRECFTHVKTSPLPVKNDKFGNLCSALISKGSLVCYTYCDKEHPFIMAISEDPWHSHLLPSFWQWSCHYLFLRFRSVAAGIRALIFHMRC